MTEREELRRRCVPSIHENGAREFMTQEETAEN
jgi:hypothetical protein